MRRHPAFRSVRHLTRALASVLIASLAPLVVGAAPAAQAAPTRTWTVLAGSQSDDMALQGMSFLPANIYIDAGDTVRWTANSAEIHTVTFLAAGQSLGSLQPFDPAKPNELLRRGGSSYNGHSYYNSGILTTAPNSGLPAVKSYSLTFPRTGTYTYYCLVHGTAMKGTVHVRAAGTPYPYSQRDYNRQAREREDRILDDGMDLWQQARDDAGRHTVIAGADDGTAMVMRFVRATVVIRTGQRVTFVNNGMGAPHTVTFGKEPANPFAKVGNPRNFRGGQLNSGLLAPHSSFTVTFTKAGTFTYVCALHDYMGMVGKVVVRDPSGD